MSDAFKVVSVTGGAVQIEIIDIQRFKADAASRFSIGSYLKVTDEDGDAIIAVVRSYRVKDPPPTPVGNDEVPPIPVEPVFIVEAHTVGHIDRDGNFKRGGQQLTIPPTSVEVATADVLSQIFSAVDQSRRLSFSTLSYHPAVDVHLDGNAFFGKHIAVVGSTGSGKSCAVAAILQAALVRTAAQQGAERTNNVHIVIFDVHGEYSSAFPTTIYNSKRRDVGSLSLPYWLMNSEELEAFFLDTEANDHNQRAIFREAVLGSKRRHNPDLRPDIVTYDAPVRFEITEVVQYIDNWNKARDNKQNVPEWKDQDPDTTELRRYPDDVHELYTRDVTWSGSKNNPRNAKFSNFVARLRGKLDDPRLRFMLSVGADSAVGDVFSDILGYGSTGDGPAQNNVTVLDLSGVPFEVLSIVISLLSRIAFDFCYYKKRYPNEGDVESPFLLVLEEAHNYVPKSGGARYQSARRAVERISKEGRKYGLSVMIVSQRPSEISATILSQCANFVVMRLSNPGDQSYIKALLPDGVQGVTDTLPSLEQGEAILIGDAMVLPSTVSVARIEHVPDSRDVATLEEWRKDWFAVDFGVLFSKILPAQGDT